MKKTEQLDLFEPKTSFNLSFELDTWMTDMEDLIEMTLRSYSGANTKANVEMIDNGLLKISISEVQELTPVTFNEAVGILNENKTQEFLRSDVNAVFDKPLY